MVSVKTLKSFYDLQEHVDRKVGDVFDVTEERLSRIEALLPGYTERVAKEDLTKMTASELISLAKERGVRLKGRPTKAQLIAALSEE